MTGTCTRCGATDPLALSGLCPTCSRRRSAARDTTRLFSRRAVRHRRRWKATPWSAATADVPLGEIRPDLTPDGNRRPGTQEDKEA